MKYIQAFLCSCESTYETEHWDIFSYFQSEFLLKKFLVQCFTFSPIIILYFFTNAFFFGPIRKFYSRNSRGMTPIYIYSVQNSVDMSTFCSQNFMQPTTEFFCKNLFCICWTNSGDN